ncbi:MAG: hypothetical protein AAF989_07365 [Planctomycetota bacterium]
MELRERNLATIHEGRESTPKVAIWFSLSHKMVQVMGSMHWFLAPAFRPDDILIIGYLSSHKRGRA